MNYGLLSLLNFMSYIFSFYFVSKRNLCMHAGKGNNYDFSTELT